MGLNKLYTDKQQAILKRAVSDNWFMMINHGAVRAGKTVLNNDLFLMELKRVKRLAEVDGVRNPMYILGAVSSSTLATNVLQEITNKYGIEFKFDRHNNFDLFGVKVITTFTEKINGVGAIRGMTSYGAYINEASLANKFVFDEIIKRCSGTGARIILDTNPDHPKHWLKTDYIDKADGEKIISNHFTIWDNSFLSDEYLENIIYTTPSGVLSDRGLKGLWTIGEGAVYSDFDSSTMTVSAADAQDANYARYIAGVDWGYEHYGAMVVIGVDSVGAYHVIEEHAYQHKHIDDWLEIAKGIAERYGERIVFWCDSARPEYVDALYMAGLTSQNANKSVIAGISEVAKLIKSGKFYVSQDATKLLDEINQYVWSAKGDKPIDTNDDVLDAVRYAIYSDRVNSMPLIQ